MEEKQERVELRDVIFEAYYPKVTRNQQGKYSDNDKEEEVLKEIVNTMRMELLLFSQVIKVDNLNPFQQELYSKFLKRSINQIPAPHREEGEEEPEHLNFERVLNLQKELMSLKPLDFAQLAEKFQSDDKVYQLAANMYATYDHVYTLSENTQRCHQIYLDSVKRLKDNEK